MIKTPARAPKANAVTERWVRGARTECLGHILIVGRGHLERTLKDYITHYNAERPHRSLALACSARGSPRRAGPPPAVVARREVLGSLIHEYYGAAA